MNAPMLLTAHLGFPSCLFLGCNPVWRFGLGSGHIAWCACTATRGSFILTRWTSFCTESLIVCWRYTKRRFLLISVVVPCFYGGNCNRQSLFCAYAVIECWHSNCQCLQITLQKNMQYRSRKNACACNLHALYVLQCTPALATQCLFIWQQISVLWFPWQLASHVVSIHALAFIHIELAIVSNCQPK